MSDTPETDAFYGELHPEQGLLEHARSLERRLRKAQLETGAIGQLLANHNILLIEAAVLRHALRIIAGYEQCADNLMSDKDVARAALAEKGKP